MIIGLTMMGGQLAILDCTSIGLIKGRCTNETGEC